MSEASKKWRVNNLEKSKEISRAHWARNKEKYKEREKAPHRRYSKAKARAKYKNKAFTLTEEEFTAFTLQPCYYCDGYFEPVRMSSGLDRIDNDKGYEMGNVFACCCSCNRTRGDRFTVEETKAIIKLIIHMRKAIL